MNQYLTKAAQIKHDYVNIAPSKTFAALHSFRSPGAFRREHTVYIYFPWRMPGNNDCGYANAI
jgi:hypothetical protein